MSQSKLEVYLHFVWVTKYRQHAIDPADTHDLYGVIGGEVRKMKGEVLAIGGMPDHIHLLVRFSREVSLARFMNQVKGVSSSFLNERRCVEAAGETAAFRWQPGYGVFSVGRNQVEAVACYVRNQARHHSVEKPWNDWEWAGEEDDAQPIANDEAKTNSEVLLLRPRGPTV